MLYAIFIAFAVLVARCYLFRNEYLKDYIEGFLSNNISKENRLPKVKSDEVIVLDIKSWADGCEDVRPSLPRIIDTIMSRDPSVLGIDYELVDKIPSDTLLIQTLKRYENKIVLSCSLDADESGVFLTKLPFGMKNVFKNVCYTNFGAKDASPRYLERYFPTKDTCLTSFWARLWEIHSDTPPGQLKSKREFINYNLNPYISQINEMSNLTKDSKYFTGNIVIIGEIKLEDYFHVPVNRNDLNRFLLSGVEVIGTATLTVGDNERSSGILDRYRYFWGGLLIMLFIAIFTFIHFSKSKICGMICKYSNIWQFIVGYGLFVLAGKISPSLDEQWYFFSIVALFILLVPIIADVEKWLFESK